MTAIEQGHNLRSAADLIASLGSLSTNNLVRLSLQRPELTQTFAVALHTLAITKATQVLPPAPSRIVRTNGNACAALDVVDILTRLIDRGDPSLARKFVPTSGSLIDLAIVAHGAVPKHSITSLLDRFLDVTVAEEILRSLFDQLVQAAAGSRAEPVVSAASVRTLARLLSSFLAACPARALNGLEDALSAGLSSCVDIFDVQLQSRAAIDLETGPPFSETDWRLHWIMARVDLLQACNLLISCNGLSAVSSRKALEPSLNRTRELLRTKSYSSLLNSTVLLDLAGTSNSWLAVKSILSAGRPPKSVTEAIASIEALAANRPKFSGAAWQALQSFVQRKCSQSSPGAGPASQVADELVATVDSVLPHYGCDKLRRILSRNTFLGQDAETIIQRLLEGDDSEQDAVVPSSSITRLATATAIPEAALTTNVTAETPASVPSLVRSRANVFGEFAFDPASVVQLKPRRMGKIDELAPELKAVILARAEAADDDDEDEEWNPFGPTARTVGVEDELDLDYEGRERGPVRSKAGDDSDGERDSADSGNEDPSRARERALIRHYIQYGSASFSSEAGIRKSLGRVELKNHIDWNDDLIESWGVMFERNPRKDKLLAAASKVPLDRDAAARRREAGAEDNTESDDGGALDRCWGPDRGRGGRILGSRGRGGSSSHRGGGGGGRGGSSSNGGSGAGGRGGSKNATRGKGTGNSSNDRSAKQKEKAGNRARQRGHDKKMARVIP
ncbi:hypothetical protein BCV70DRAFT_198923 [Testicularia cyperi]|uniref:CUE domain-containing protein n=1 Tax=Testicularia cyperi TaxID=1882483 RepID=A0A317XVX1_9BASI|nr:hypothetical protein BCV70DRAFT_198923 [Testicularia cyperi]